jgi:hypothetical protein
LLKTKNFTEFSFLTIRQIRTKTVVETRIEHAALGPLHNEAARCELADFRFDQHFTVPIPPSIDR